MRHPSWCEKEGREGRRIEREEEEKEKKEKEKEKGGGNVVIETCVKLKKHTSPPQEISPSPDRGGVSGHSLLVIPEQRVQSILVCFFQEGNVFHCLSLLVGTHAGHRKSKLPRTLKVSGKKLVEDLHVDLLLEGDVIGQVLKHLQVAAKLNSTYPPFLPLPNPPSPFYPPSLSSSPLSLNYPPFFILPSSPPFLS